MRNLHSTALAIAMLAGGGLSTTALAQGTAANDPAKSDSRRA